MLGREVVEREQHIEIVGDLGSGVRPLRPYSPANAFAAFLASSLFSAL
jgi:hypothetical protein